MLVQNLVFQRKREISFVNSKINESKAHIICNFASFSKHALPKWLTFIYNAQYSHVDMFILNCYMNMISVFVSNLLQK